MLAVTQGMELGVTYRVTRAQTALTAALQLALIATAAVLGKTVVRVSCRSGDQYVFFVVYACVFCL